jgi:hypothetical protein
VTTTRPLALLLIALAGPVGAQGLPFQVSVFDWDNRTRESMTRGFKGLNAGREVLYCVEAWRTADATESTERIVIERVRLERGGGTNRVTDVGNLCIGDNGQPLPMIHTHADGNCQFSPADLITTVARQAPFEGVQCGPQHFIWTAAWQVLAVATSVEQAALRKPPPE